jgi:hypothetical protein
VTGLYDFTMGTSISLEECDVSQCEMCDRKLDADPYDADGEVLCEVCLVARGEKILAAATVFADEHCKITGAIDTYDLALRDASTRAEYAAGLREGCTVNAVAARNRHRCTNYEELIKDLREDSFEDRISYHAIRPRIDELLGVEETP